MVSRESARSTITLSSFANNYNGSISARRSQFHRQNSFGVAPNRFVAFFYWLKDLTTSTDTTDEKIASTVLVCLFGQPMHSLHQVVCLHIFKKNMD